MGIIEFSVLLYDKAMITNASREGARAGCLFDSPANVSDVVNHYLQNNLISLGAGGSNATITHEVIPAVRTKIYEGHRFLPV